MLHSDYSLYKSENNSKKFKGSAEWNFTEERIYMSNKDL